VFAVVSYVAPTGCADLLGANGASVNDEFVVFIADIAFCCMDIDLGECRMTHVSRTEKNIVVEDMSSEMRLFVLK